MLQERIQVQSTLMNNLIPSSDRLRQLGYHGTDVFLVLFSIANPISFENVTSKWIPEIKHVCPGAKFLIVGLKMDLRTDPQTLEKLTQKNMKPISTSQVHFNLKKKKISFF
jgi:small GTP-binding protein